MTKLNTEKIKEQTKSFLIKIWRNLSLILLFFLILDLIIGGILFWQYFINPQQEEQITPSLAINKDLAEKISNEWIKRDALFENAAEKEYPDPFLID